MKKITIALMAAVALCGCSVQQAAMETKRITIVNFLDFQKYEEEGFFISSTPYVGEYKNIGEVEVGIIPAKGNYKIPSELNPEWYRIEYKEEDIDSNEALAIIVKEAKAKGADALVNLRMTKEYGGRIKYTMSGLCIKRK